MNPLVLGIISAVVAHNMDAVRDMLWVLARQEPETATQIRDALERGVNAAERKASA